MADSPPGWLSHPPSVGDITTCYYPGDGKGLLRPVLVLELLVADDADEFAIRVAYGTTNLVRPERAAVSLIVDDAGQMNVCGLAKATRFDLKTQVTLPWDTQFVGCWRGFSSPIIGALPKGLQIDCAHIIAAMN